MFGAKRVMRSEKSLKILTAADYSAWLTARARIAGHHWRRVMTKKTCAACDYPLEANPMTVNIGGKTVEVCCEECAQKLQEAHASAKAAPKR